MLDVYEQTYNYSAIFNLFLMLSVCLVFLIIVCIFPILVVTDELLDEVLQLLVLVGLAAQQVGDIVTGQAQASHK